jgi:hypothetical protein
MQMTPADVLLKGGHAAGALVDNFWYSHAGEEQRWHGRAYPVNFTAAVARWRLRLRLSWRWGIPCDMLRIRRKSTHNNVCSVLTRSQTGNLFRADNFK